MPSRYAALSREQLAILVPELLLCGHLIDRAGMAWCIEAFGREEMAQIAIEEWMGASPIYTRRMQRALGYEGDDIVTIFKGLQLDIGAPPQFMDFRFAVEDRWNGRFELAHCGALMDVEPMGESYVRSMCHDIEDPTFDATAVATNPHAQIRPLHRPPRTPADRTPHCAWTVRISPEHPPVSPAPACLELQESLAAQVELDPIEPGASGLSRYDGPLLADLDFAAFSHAALVRIADEVALQMQLLNLSFVAALRRRTDEAQVRTIATKQATGIAGLTAERLTRALAITDPVQLLRLHPMLNPAAYVDLDEVLTLRPGAASVDGGWIGLLGPGEARPLHAIVQAIDPRWKVVVAEVAEGLRIVPSLGTEPATDFDEVVVTRFSTGAGFAFEPRRSLPLL